MSVRDLYQFGGNFTMTPHRSASTNITGYSYVSQDRLLATTIKVVGTFDGESISRYGFQWALDGNNWHDVVLYNGSWTNVMNITAEKNIKISALQGSVYLRSFITRKDYDTTYSPSILYRYNNVIRMNVGELITNDFTRNARASEINVEDGFQYVLYDPAVDEIAGFDTELNLISIDLNDTNTTELGRNAFKGCSNLETVTLPSTLQVIGENAFVDNEKLTSVDTYNVSEIGDNAFKNCVAMESLVLGEEVTEIGDNAFNGCSSLVDVTSYALEPPALGTGNFTTSGDTLYVPNEAVSLYEEDSAWSDAFSTIRPLQNYIRIDVVAGDHGTASGSGWYETGDTVVISATADTGYHFLQWNDGNTDNPRTITVGATDVTYTASFLVDAGTVGNTSYSSLTYTSVTCSALFSGLDTTGYGFCYSTTNSTPDLNDTVVTIGTGSINATASASLINLTEATKYYIRGYITNAGGTSYNTAIEVSTNTYTIVYNASSEITGTWVDNNTDTTRNTYDSVTGDGVLYLNAGVRTIGGGDNPLLSPFYENTDLISVDFTNSNIRYFGSYAFYGCENLETVNLGTTASTIGNFTFYHCKELESIDLTGITSIGNNAFNTCSSLVSLTIPSSITTIENNTFDYCISLETIILPSTIISIKEASFGHCNSLISVTCYATSVPTLGANNFIASNDTLYVPYSSIASYNATSPWNTDFEQIRPIGDYSYLSVTAGSHGSVTGGGWYLNGTTAQISATADTHYHFDKWSDGDTNAIRNILVSQDASYTASFEVNSYVITVVGGDHGSATGGGTYDYGTSVQISATPDTDYNFTGWNDGNTDNPRTITVTGDATYTASFAINSYTLTLSGDAHTSVTGSGTYPSGTSVQIEATPDSHYHFVQWSDGNTDNPRTITVTSNITLSASSALDMHTITVTSDAHGTASGSGTYVYGVSVGISITPDSNYHFVSWNDGNTSNPRSVTVTGDATYSGTTAIDQFTLTVTGDLNTTVTGSGTYDYGTSVQITATPNTHYHFVAWSDGDTNATRTIVVTSDITLTATSAIDTYVVTVTGDANTDTTSGSGTYGYGSSVQISATPVAHYHFARWQDNNTDNPRTITVTSDVTYTATTAIDQHVITTQGDSHIASVTGGGLYDYGTQVTLTATADTGYHFVQWTDGNTDNPRTITVTEDATYRATSALNIYTITVNGDAHTASTTGSGQWGYGSQFQISATPDSNYHFVAWNDGNTDNPRYITVTGDATYTASMAIDTFTLTVLSDDINEGSVSGGGTYDYGTSVQISATAETGYEFVEWNDSNTDNPRTITVTSNATYTAYFQSSVPLAQIRYNATSAATGNWVTNNTDTSQNTWDSVTGDGVLYLNSGVTSIGGGGSTDYSPFYTNTAVTEVDFSDSGLTTIGQQTCYQCGNLTSVTIPEGVTTLGQDAFYTCSSLTNVIIPNSVTTIGNYTFRNCSGLTSVTIGSGVTSIGNKAFSLEPNLLSVTCLATSVPTLGTENFTATGDVLYVPSASVSAYQADSAWVNAFTAIRPIGFNIINYNATSEVTGTWVTNNTETSMNTWDSVTGDGTLFLKPGVTSIGGDRSADYSPFYFYRGLTSVVLPSQITTIDTYAFYYCLDATSFTIPNTVTSIGEYAFFSCQALPSLTIPDSVTTIGKRAFENCYVLTSVTLPNAITSINAQLFAGCEDLPSITIPASVTSIGNSAFTQCDSLLSVTCLATSVPTLGTGNFTISGDTLYVHPRSVSAYQASTAWVNAFTNIRPFANVILYNATSAASGDWVTNNTDTTKNSWDSVSGDGILYLNNGVTTLGATSGSSDSPFFHNTGLTSLDLSYSSITAIGQNAINGCTSLTTVTMSPDITQLYYGAFANCSSLTTIDLSHITILSDYAFASCSSLASVDITSAGSIYEGCFEYCTALSSITFPTTCSSIAVNSFRDCSSLTEIELPSTITYIGADAFNGCTNLMKVTCNATSVPFLNQRNFTATGDVLYVPSASVSSYQADSAWLNAFSAIVPIGAKFIRYKATSQATGTWVTNNTNTSQNTWDSVSGDGVLVLNSGVTSIGGGNTTDYTPFVYSDVVSVDFSDSSITTFADSAIRGNSNLTSITLPSGLTTIANSVFYNCTALETIDIPSGVTSIGTGAFGSCTKLRSITVRATTPPTLSTNNFNLANSTLYVPETAFGTYAGNSSWNGVITHLAVIGVDYFIAYKASSQYSNSNSWIAANTNTSSNKWNSTGGRGFLVLKSDHARLGGGQSTSYSPFYQSTAVEVVHAKFNSKNIDSNAFNNCTKLTQFKCEGVTRIGASCFRYDAKLKHVVLSADVSVTGIAEYGFGGCTALVNVYCYATTPPSLASNNFPASSDTLYVPSSAVSTYQSNSSWNSVFTTITSI